LICSFNFADEAMETSFSIQLVGQNWQALPEKALFWIEENALLLSDLHLGRAAHLRKHGYALADHAHIPDILNLKTLLAKRDFKTIYVLGDLFHSHTLGDLSLIESLIQESQSKWVLIKGNHDVFEEKTYLKMGFHQVKTEFVLGGKVLLKHEPEVEDLERYFCISGHVHPGYRIQGKAKQAITLPCFYFTDEQIILPAIGMLTGYHRLKRKSKKEIFVVCHAHGVQSI